jgi:hypothetical protein
VVLSFRVIFTSSLEIGSAGLRILTKQIVMLCGLAIRIGCKPETATGDYSAMSTIVRDTSTCHDESHV